MNELPQNWTRTTLREVANPVSERINPARVPDLPYVGLEHIEARTMRVLGLDKARNYKSSAICFRPGSVLYGRLRPYLNKVAKMEIDGVCSAEFIVFAPSAALSNEFLQYLLNSTDFVSFASHLKEGDRPRVDYAQISSYAFGLPPLPEQHRIVAEIEKQFTRLEQANAALAQTVRRLSVLRSNLLGLAARAGEHVEPLGHLLREPLANGRSVPTATVGESSVPVLRLTSVREGQIDLDEKKHGAWSEDEARPFSVTEGDFLIVRGNGSKKLVGRAGVVGKVLSQIAYPDTLIRARFRHDRVYLPFMAAAWDSSFIRRQIESAARTTAGIYKINQKDIEAISLPAFSVAEQEQRHRVWSAYDSILRNAEHAATLSATRAHHLRLAILAKALSGQLVPQDPTDEPALSVSNTSAVNPRNSKKTKGRTLRAAG